MRFLLAVLAAAAAAHVAGVVEVATTFEASTGGAVNGFWVRLHLRAAPRGPRPRRAPVRHCRTSSQPFVLLIVLQQHTQLHSQLVHAIYRCIFHGGHTVPYATMTAAVTAARYQPVAAIHVI